MMMMTPRKRFRSFSGRALSLINSIVMELDRKPFHLVCCTFIIRMRSAGISNLSLDNGPPPDGRRENDVLRRMDAQYRLALNVPIAGRGQSNIRMC